MFSIVKKYLRCSKMCKKCKSLPRNTNKEPDMNVVYYCDKMRKKPYAVENLM